MVNIIFTYIIYDEEEKEKEHRCVFVLCMCVHRMSLKSISVYVKFITLCAYI